MSDQVPAIIRRSFRILSALSPKIAGDLAFRLFCRPPSPRKIRLIQRSLEAATTPLLNNARRRSIELPGHTDGLFNIMAYEFEPPPRVFTRPVATTLLLHGWSSRATHMLAFVQPLLDAGHRVLAVDLPGHGYSSGKSFHIPLGVETLHAAQRQLGDWNNMIAHSLGGAVATAAVAGTITHCKPLSLERLVLLSTPNSVPAIFTDFGAAIGLNQQAVTALGHHAKRLSGSELSDFIGNNQLRRSCIRTLVIHDSEDRELPLSEALDLVANNPQAEFHEVNGFGHRRILTESTVVQRAVDFCVSRDNLTTEPATA